MANNPKKVKDPTEVALSAIQEALNIADAPAPGLGLERAEQKNRGERPPLPRSEPVAPPPLNERLAPAFDDHDDVPSTRMDLGHAEAAPAARRPAANDDRETIGQLLQALQKGLSAAQLLHHRYRVLRHLGCRHRRADHRVSPPRCRP